MTPTSTQLLAIQCAIAVILYVFFFRKTDLPFSLKILLIGTYITVPLALLVKGVQSAIYLSDFFLPMFLISFFVSSRESRHYRRGLTSALLLLIVILPLVLAFVLSSLGDQRGGLGGRNIKGDAIWLYRNLTYVVLLGYGVSLSLSVRQILSFFHMSIVLAGILALMGLMNYYGPFNLATFENLAFKELVTEGYQENRVGLGFMGLFRASVGQWFAMVTLMIAGTYTVMPRRHRLVAILIMGASVGIILSSHSRAGLVGVCTGLVLLSVLAKGKVPLTMTLIAACGMVGLMFFKQDLFTNRIASIFSGSLNAYDRVEVWRRSYDFFSQHTDALLLGVGPANRQMVFEVIGAYGAHNEYLDAIFRLGFLGLVGLMGFLVVLVMTLWTARSQFGGEGHAVLTTAVVVVLANCVMGITQEHLLHDYASHTMGIFIYLLYGVVLGAESHGEMEDSVFDEDEDRHWESEADYATASSQR